MSRHKCSTDFIILLSSTHILESSWICVSFIKHKIRKTVYPILRRFRKKVSFDLFGWTACWSKSFKADLSSWICIKVLLLKRTSQQGEIELPPESTKLKSESDFWRYFRISCHARWEIKRETLIYSHIFTFFWFLLCGIIWCRGPVTQNGFTLFIVLCLVSTVSMTVSGSCKGKRVLPNPRHKRLRHMNTDLRKRRLGTIMLCKADISYDHCTKVVPQVTYKLYS